MTVIFCIYFLISLRLAVGFVAYSPLTTRHVALIREDAPYSSCKHLPLSLSGLESFVHVPTSSVMVSAEQGGLPLYILLPSIFLFGAASAFVYANLVYTPEILDGAEQMRQDNRGMEMQKVLSLVQEHLLDGQDLEELRKPLEAALEMPIEDYVRAVDHTSSQDESASTTTYTTADVALANILRSM